MSKMQASTIGPVPWVQTGIANKLGLLAPAGHVFNRLASPPAVSSAFLLSSLDASGLPPNSTGGFASDGVGNVSGLGSTALFNPPLPQLSQSLNKPPGEAIRDCSMYREGNAEMGVSRVLPVLFRFSANAVEFCCDVGGGGRAKGLGGPDAPADSKADAEGDGGGSTMPL